MVDCNEHRFMSEYDSRLELAPRDVVSQSIVSQMGKTQHPCVYLSLRHLQVDKVHNEFPGFTAACKKFGLEPSFDLIPVRPGAHYMIGGVEVDLEGRTSLEGLWAAGEVIHNLFIVLAVDEALAGASGCSIDKSVAFVRILQERYEIDLLDRMTFVYRDMLGDIHTASRQNFARLYDMGVIDDETTVFDTVVPTLGDFRNSFELPLQKSWHRRMVTMSV